MNRYDADYSVLPTLEENQAYSEIIAEVARDFGGKLSGLLYVITVRYPAMGTEETYHCYSSDTASKIIARSRVGNCPTTFRVTHTPTSTRKCVERPSRPGTLKDVIQQLQQTWAI